MIVDTFTSWGLAYQVYLQSPTWAEKRRLVMKRCSGICEGCGLKRASEVHHRSYPKRAEPGSGEWMRQEKLFDLVALCDQCHDDLHLL